MNSEFSADKQAFRAGGSGSELARQAGLKVGRGVIVNDSFVTSDPDVLAIGDAAETPSLLSGLWPIAATQAKAAVAALCGLDPPTEAEVMLS